MRPSSVNILGKEYSITYLEKPSDVDISGRESLWGQIDFWSHSIRVYGPDKFSNEEILDSLLHEVLHGIEKELKLTAFKDKHGELGLLAMALADFLVRNGWLKESDTC